MAASADLARRLLEAALTAETLEEANLFRKALDACTHAVTLRMVRESRSDAERAPLVTLATSGGAGSSKTARSRNPAYRRRLKKRADQRNAESAGGATRGGAAPAEVASAVPTEQRKDAEMHFEPPAAVQNGQEGMECAEKCKTACEDAGACTPGPSAELRCDEEESTAEMQAAVEAMRNDDVDAACAGKYEISGTGNASGCTHASDAEMQCDGEESDAEIQPSATVHGCTNASGIDLRGRDMTADVIKTPPMMKEDGLALSGNTGH